MGKVFAKIFLNIAELFKVKTIVTLAIVFTVCKLTIAGTVATDAFMGIAGAIVTYYFNKSDSNKEYESEVRK